MCIMATPEKESTVRLFHKCNMNQFKFSSRSTVFFRSLVWWNEEMLVGHIYRNIITPVINEGFYRKGMRNGKSRSRPLQIWRILPRSGRFFWVQLYKWCFQPIFHADLTKPKHNSRPIFLFTVDEIWLASQFSIYCRWNLASQFSIYCRWNLASHFLFTVEKFGTRIIVSK